MVRRWILYLAVLAGLTVFNWAYQAWFSWLVLQGVLYLPVVSLVMSLPAMLLTKLWVAGPSYLPQETEQKAWISANGALPAPPYSGRIRVTRTTTGETWLLKAGNPLPTEHCGQLQCRAVRGRIYDYLGLFFLPVKQKGMTSVIVRPKEKKLERFPQLERYISTAWRPKPGGGFAENHELRLYRPGDNLTQIHWKLSAKTGKYIVREALEPVSGRVLLEMELRGDAAALDQKFGKLLGISSYLLRLGLRHELRVLTGNGVQCLVVSGKEQQAAAVDMLLSMPPAAPETELETIAAAWQYRIGGGDDEA